jgi:hypothetical protein
MSTKKKHKKLQAVVSGSDLQQHQISYVISICLEYMVAMRLTRLVHRPYRSPTITLKIGPEGLEYYVASDLVKNSIWESSRSPVRLPDLDENTGHVLVHYLYTGTYQTLGTLSFPDSTRPGVEFKRAVLAYQAAKTYELPGLQKLAKGSIERFGSGMDIFDVLEATKDILTNLSHCLPWFYGYLEEKVKLSFEKDHTIFASGDFFKGIDNVALLQILAGSVVGLYNDKLCSTLNAESAYAEGIFEAGVQHGESEPVEAVPDGPSFDEPVERGSPDETAIPEEVTEEYPLEAPDGPVPEEPPEIEEIEYAEAPAQEQFPVPEEPVPESRPQFENEDDTWKDWGLSFSAPGKKKKKKKKVRQEAPVGYEPEPAPPDQNEWPSPLPAGPEPGLKVA